MSTNLGALGRMGSACYRHFARQAGDTLTLAVRSDANITSPAVQARVTWALAPFRQAPHVTGVDSLSVNEPAADPAEVR